MTPLEQFNEEVMKEFDRRIHFSLLRPLYYPEIDTDCYEICEKSVKNFITQKLAAHKELILKMVREKMLRDTRLDTLAIDNIEDDLDELGRILK